MWASSVKCRQKWSYRVPPLATVDYWVAVVFGSNAPTAVSPDASPSM
jgi:hypothetical protein